MRKNSAPKLYSVTVTMIDGDVDVYPRVYSIREITHFTVLDYLGRDAKQNTQICSASIATRLIRKIEKTEDRL